MLEHTLSACLRQSILLIFPFWSGLDRTHMAGFLPVMERTKSSLHSWAMSFLNFPSSLDAHFCFTSGFSAWKKQKDGIREFPKEMCNGKNKIDQISFLLPPWSKRGYNRIGNTTWPREEREKRRQIFLQASQSLPLHPFFFPLPPPARLRPPRFEMEGGKKLQISPIHQKGRSEGGRHVLVAAAAL